MSDMGEDTPVHLPVGGAAFGLEGLILSTPYMPPSTPSITIPAMPANLADRIQALEDHAAALAKESAELKRECATLKQNDVHQAQLIIHLKQRLNGTGGQPHRDAPFVEGV